MSPDGSEVIHKREVTLNVKIDELIPEGDLSSAKIPNLLTAQIYDPDSVLKEIVFDSKIRKFSYNFPKEGEYKIRVALIYTTNSAPQSTWPEWRITAK